MRAPLASPIVRAPRWLLAPAVVPVVATMAMDPAGYAPFGPAKWAAVAVIVLTAAAVAVRKGVGGFDHATTLVWLVFLGWTALCGFAGRDPWYAQAGTPERHAGLVLWLLAFAAFLTGQRSGIGGARAVVRGAVVAAVGLGFYAVVELVWRAPVATDASPSRLGGPFGSAAFLGAACCLLGPVALGVAADGTFPRAWRVAAGVGAGGVLVALAGSGTRGAWLAVLVVAMIVALARRAAVGRRPELVAALMAGAVLIGVAVAVAGPRGGTSGSTTDRTTPVGARLDEWRIGWRALSRHWFVSVGPEGYRIVFPQVVDDDYERAYGRDVIPDRAHDVFLDLGITVGLPGLLAYLALLGLVGRRVWRVLCRGPAALAGAAAGVVAYGVQQVVLFPVAELEPVAWLMAGALVAVEARPVAWSRLVRPFAPGLAVVAGLMAFLGGLDVAADRAVARSFDAAGAGRSGDAVTEALDAARWRPDQVRYRIAAARALARVDRTAALAQLDAAAQWSPDEPALPVERAAVLGTVTGWQAALEVDPRRGRSWLELGLVAARSGQYDIAERAWARATELAPEDPVVWLNLARLRIDRAQWSEARAALAAAEALAPGDPRAVALRDELRRAGHAVS